MPEGGAPGEDIETPLSAPHASPDAARPLTALELHFYNKLINISMSHFSKLSNLRRGL